MKRALLIFGSLLVFSAGLLAQTPPNFIIIFTDDQGYEDLEVGVVILNVVALPGGQ